MLEVIEQTPQRLVLRDQRPTAGLISLLFTALSVGAVGLLIGQGISVLDARLGDSDAPYWLLGMGVFITLGIGFVLLGIGAVLHFLVGTTCVFDREAEQVIVERVALFRTQAEHHSIYGVSHVHVEANEEVHAYGVFLVLRSQQRVPVASFHKQDEDAMRALVREIRAFLRGL